MRETGPAVNGFEVGGRGHKLGNVGGLQFTASKEIRTSVLQRPGTELGQRSE